jgi:hypothetical protein
MKLNFLKVVMASVLSGALCACGEAGKVKVLTEEDAQRVLKEASVTCQGADCHDSVALLAAVTYSSDSEKTMIVSGSCTATLIAPNMMLTNSHCIPDPVKEGKRPCATSIRFVFPVTEHMPSEDAYCEEVVYFSPHRTGADEEAMTDLHGEGEDIAIVRTSREVARPKVALSYEGLAERTKISAHKMDPGYTPGSITGKIRTMKCSSSFKSDDNYKPFLGRLSRILRFDDCLPTLRGGNSGSVILLPNGEGVGLFQSDNLKVCLGTNLACVQNDILTRKKRTLSEECSK